MDSHDNDQKEVEYQSADIARKPKAQYFVRVKDKKTSVFDLLKRFWGYV